MSGEAFGTHSRFHPGRAEESDPHDVRRQCAAGSFCKVHATRDAGDGSWWCGSHLTGAQHRLYGRCSFVGAGGRRCVHRRFTFVEPRGLYETEKRDGWCRLHGSAPLDALSVADREGLVARLFADVRDAGDGSGCWVWTGRTTARAMRGSFRAEGITWLPHRLMWALFFGGHKNTHELAHLCDRGEPLLSGGRIVRGACVNPYHLKPMTAAAHERWRFNADSLNTHVFNVGSAHPVPEYLLDRFGLDVGFWFAPHDI